MKCIQRLQQSLKDFHRWSQFTKGLGGLAAPAVERSLSLPTVYFVDKKTLRKSHSVSAVRENEVLKDAFMYHQRINILDEKKQSCYLTKSILKSELPNVFQKSLDLNEDELKKIMGRFEQNIIHTRLFCPGDDHHKRRENSALDMFLNMLHIAWGNTSHRYPTNFTKSINYKQHFAAAFSRLNKYDVQITGKPEKSFLMMSKNEVKQFSSGDEVFQSADQKIVWDEIFKPIFHMQELNTSFKTHAPFLSRAPYNHPHTLFIVSDKRTKMDHLIGQGILYSFANAYTHALANPHNSGNMEKIKPVCVQCVINDGLNLTFICYQLNTLDFTSDNGIKNFVWVEESIPMFEEAYLKIPGDKRYKGIKETEIYVDGFNKEALKKFLKFVLNY